MTEDTRDVVRAGLVTGLQAHVAKLFSVYVNCQDRDGYDRCLRGLDGAILAYEALIRCVEQSGSSASDDEVQS